MPLGWSHEFPFLLKNQVEVNKADKNDIIGEFAESCHYIILSKKSECSVITLIKLNQWKAYD